VAAATTSAIHPIGKPRIEGKLGFGSLFSNSFACVTPVNPRLLAGTALLLAVFAREAAAEKARPARPAGKSIEVEVMRGGSVRIPLRGFERNLNRLEYRPIGSPRYG
jgi:hypothetical protein